MSIFNSKLKNLSQTIAHLGRFQVLFRGFNLFSQWNTIFKMYFKIIYKSVQNIFVQFFLKDPCTWQCQLSETTVNTLLIFCYNQSRSVIHCPGLKSVKNICFVQLLSRYHETLLFTLIKLSSIDHNMTLNLLCFRWEEERQDDGTKWKFLEHKGPVFAPAYEPLPSNVKFYYNGNMKWISITLMFVENLNAHIPKYTKYIIII